MTAADDFVRHVVREHNKRADCIANKAVNLVWVDPGLEYEQTWQRVLKNRHFAEYFIYRGSFDGHKTKTIVSAGWSISRARWTQDFSDMPEVWSEVAHMCIVLDKACSVLDSECIALRQLVAAFALLTRCELQSDALRNLLPNPSG